MRCPFCNAKSFALEELLPDGTYCNDCGAMFKTTGCPSCGSPNVTELDDNYWQCNDCKEKIRKEE